MNGEGALSGPRTTTTTLAAQLAEVAAMVSDRTVSFDRRLGARIAFRPKPSPEFTAYLEGIGYEWMADSDDPLQVLAGGLLIRVAVLERALAGREAA